MKSCKRCKRCAYSAKVGDYDICDFLGRTGRARSMICTIENCTVFKAKQRKKASDTPLLRQQGSM